MLTVPPTWRLPVSGQVGRSVAAHSDVAGDRGDEVLGLGVPRVSGSGPVRKRFRLNRKTPAHFAGFIDTFSSMRLEETASGWFSRYFLA